MEWRESRRRMSKAGRTLRGRCAGARLSCGEPAASCCALPCGLHSAADALHTLTAQQGSPHTMADAGGAAPIVHRGMAWASWLLLAVGFVLVLSGVAALQQVRSARRSPLAARH